jgi:hypothetical protein
MARFYMFSLIQDQLAKEGIPGDLAEIGTYKGHTAAVLAKAARRLDRTLYLFDTFEGFDERDFQGIDAHRLGEFADTSLEAVKALVGEDHVTFVKGFFPETASAVPDQAKFSLVHIDCDLYAPVRSALEFFYPRLSPGGFMLVHDYTAMGWPGVEKAVDEFLAGRPESPVPMTDGSGTALFRKAKPAESATQFSERRANALRSGWLPAQSGLLTLLLESGWCNPEPFGRWGTGAHHEMVIYFTEPPRRDLQLEAECRVVLIGARTEQKVDVYVADKLAATWEFRLDANRAIRSVPIPARTAGENFPQVRVRFVPRSVATPLELDPTVTKDSRPLGVGVMRMRLVDAP